MIDKTVIFLHMFKAGGTTVANKIADNYDVGKYAIMNTNIKNPRHPIRMEDPGLVTGHFSFGIHRWIDKPCVYITFLRDPVERLQSVYYNIREPRCANHPLHTICNTLSLLEFVSSSDPAVRTQVDNYQVRELNSMAIPDFNNIWMCGEDLLRAQGNIQRFFVFVELTENINKALPALKKKFGWEKGPLEDLLMNVTQDKPSDIPENIKEEIRRRNHLDNMLIEWIKIHKNGINQCVY